MNVNADKILRERMQTEAGKKVLLHACCAPCASSCLEELAQAFSVTVLFYNPNLDSEEEYARRKGELLRYLRETGLADAAECDYSPSDFTAVARGYEGEPEGGARCARCFSLRLTRTAREAKARGYDYFCTTLTLSPLKNAALLNALGEEIGAREGVEYLPSDFKKRGGYLRSLELSRTYGLYRQNYCGCVYSRRDRT